MIMILRNLSIAILIWMMIFPLHGFFRELYKILKERYEDWENKKRILHKVDKLIKEGFFERENRKKGSTRITVKGNKIIIKKEKKRGNKGITMD